MGRYSYRWVLALFCILSFATVASADTFVDSGFISEVVSGTAGSPIGFTFAPDGRIFVWHKGGTIRIIKNGAMTATPFIDISDHVNRAVDRGLDGVAIDFANGWVYMAYVYEPPNPGPCVSNPGATANTCPDTRTQRITRVKIDPTDPDVSTGSEEVLLGTISDPNCADNTDCMPNNGGTHTVDQLVLGTDGKLWLSVGEGANFGTPDIRSMRAQNLDALQGKVLRFNTDGTGVADNPFYDGNPNSNRSKVWALGLRNPYRFTFDSATGNMYLGDVGWNDWEEIDHITKGGNYGWPCVEGPATNTDYVAAFPNECASITTANTVAPIHSYNHSTGSLIGKTVILGPVYQGGAYPAQYKGSLFYADFVMKFFRRLTLDSNGNKVSDIPFGTLGGAASGTDYNGPVFFAVGPDGNIYYLLLASQQLKRIRFVGSGNKPPVAQASATPLNGPSPLTVTFSSNGSSDPEGQPLTYHWDFGDGTTSTDPNPVHTYTSTGVVTRTVTLTVTDNQSATASDQVSVTVGDRAPVPAITTPVNNTSFHVGDTISFSGGATDPEDGVIPASRLKWELTLIHTDHEHFITEFAGVDHGSWVVENHGEGVFTYRLQLIATDTNGLSASVISSFPITPAAAQDFAISATPASATVTGGQSATFTVNVTHVAGSASFDSAVALSCSGLPAGAACNFSPPSVTPGAGTATSTLTITTIARAGMLASGPLGVISILLLFWAGLGLRRGSPRSSLAALALFVGLVTLGCGGSKGITPNPQPQPQPVTVTITGTSGAITHSTTVTLTIQ